MMIWTVYILGPSFTEGPPPGGTSMVDASVVVFRYHLVVSSIILLLSVSLMNCLFGVFAYANGLPVTRSPGKCAH